MISHTLLRLLVAALLSIFFVNGAYSQDGTQNVLPDAFGEFLFIENLGQIRGSQGEERPDVLFLARSQGMKTYITRTGITYALRGNPPSPVESKRDQQESDIDTPTACYCRLDMEFVGANTDIRITGEQVADLRLSYFTKHHPEGVFPRAYKKVVVENIYDGIDIVYHQKDGKMKYDLVVKAGADAGEIRMKYSGATAVYVDDAGNLVARTALGEIVEENPYTYSKSTGEEVACAFEVNEQVARFKLDRYNQNDDLVIDPIRRWATFYGGSDDDSIRSCCTDSAGNLYLLGNSGSDDFPFVHLPGAYNNTTQGTLFISKFTPLGEAIWATYYGGGGASFIRTDNADNLYCAGTTTSAGFPTHHLAGAYNQSTHAGYYDAYLLKFSPAGELLWATLYGGTDKDTVSSFCADSEDNVYLCGTSWSADLPTQALVGAYNQPANAGYYDLFIVKFSALGEMAWGTYYGAIGSDHMDGGCIDSADNLYLTGHTNSFGFPTQILPGAFHQPSKSGDDDAFILKFNSSGERQWSTFYGGTQDDWPSSCCTDASDNFYCGGRSTSDNFPTKRLEGAYYQPTKVDYSDLFFMKFNNSGERLWATFYGGSSYERLYGLCADHLDNLYATGETYSSDFPVQTQSGAYNQTTSGGSYDSYVVMFDAQCARPWATYYGSSGDEDGFDVCTDPDGNLFVVGHTKSSGLPTMEMPGAYNQPAKLGVLDGFILRFDIPFISDIHSVSVSAGGTANLSLNAGEANAGRLYLILGSMSGSYPGIPLPHGGATLPVNWDQFTHFVINHLNLPALTHFLAPLDSEGLGTAQLIARPGLAPSKIGQVMTFAFCLEGQPLWDFASNYVEIEFVP